MGKTPGKWIKNLLLGRKSSKSSLSKGREKSASKGETVVSSKLAVPELTVSAPVISAPFVGTAVSNAVNSEIRAAAEVPNDNITISPPKEDGKTQAISSLGSLDQRIKREEAATKAQSAYRGYVARRAYRTLKGIIRLQALIRGHLVRRQAVSTLLCVQGIVKLQALIRGQHIRHSDIGVEVHKIHQGATCFDYSGASASSQVEWLSENAYAQKLLASLPTISPLRLQYDPEDTNSNLVWLDRWTRSCFWEPVLQLKKKPDLKSCGKYKKIQTVETEPVNLKRTVRRLSTENGPNRDSEKPKRIMKKVSSHSVNSVQEHKQNGVEKVKSNIRKSDPKEAPNSKKVSDPKKKVSDSKEEVSDHKKKPSYPKEEASDRSEVDMVIPKHSTGTILAPAALDDQHTNEISLKMQHVEVSISKHSDPEKCQELPPDETLQKLDDHPSVDMQSMENNDKNEEVQALNEVLTSADNFISNEGQKTNQRRASLPVKFDHRENGIQTTPLKFDHLENGVQTTPRVPSYMAPTESARARLKGQGSPKFARDVVEKNLLTRRHSLSSSTNMKLSLLSPRAQKLAQGKVIRTDRSLSSSRDGFDKGIQPEWRR